MAYMDWSAEYETGVYDIDNDHRVLFMFVNDLHDKVTDGAGDEIIAETLNGLVNYVNVHFVREELLMDEAGYPDAAEHAEAHTKLSAQVFEIKEAFDEDPASVDHHEVLEFLKRWLSGHILHSDMDYVPYVRAGGDGAAEAAG